MKAKGLCNVAVVLVLGIYGLGVARGQAQTQAPKPSGDVWTGIPTPPPGGPYPKVVVLKDLPPPKPGAPRTKPRSIDHRPIVPEQVKEEARRRAMELRAKTPPEELPKPPLPQQPNAPAAVQAPSSTSSAMVSPNTPTQSTAFIPPTTASEDATCNSNIIPSDMAISASRSFVVQVTNSCTDAAYCDRDSLK